MIRSLFPLLLSLLLCGCAAQNPLPETTTPAITAVQETSPALSMERRTADDALQQYQLSEPVSGILPMGQNLLLFSGGDPTTLALIKPQTDEILALYDASMVLTPQNFTVQKLHCGLSWFDGAAMETVILDDTLQPERRIPAPEGLTGAPLLSKDGSRLFYCTADAVRILDLSTGISRMLKEAAYPVQGLTGLLLEDSVLQISITDTDGSWRTLFLSAETGQLLREIQGNLLPQTTADSYFLSLEEGILFGKTDTAPMLLHPRQAEADAFFLPKSSGAVTAALSDGNTILDRYDLASGSRSASLTLPGIHTVQSLCEASDGSLWILSVEATGTQILYRWESNHSPVADDQFYLSAYHTREEPDYDGLASCSLRAAALGESYGVEILVYRDAVAAEPWDYRLEPEYQVSTLNRELDALEQNLSRLPPGFLSRLAETFTSLNICLVQSAQSTQTGTGPEAVSGIQFLEDYNAYIVLCCGENTEKALYHELCHLMETVVLTESCAYDRWENLNPEGFQYGRAPDREWLQPGREWFIDGYAMSHAKEDRARIFEYAMTSGNEALFRSPPLQNKLRQLSIGIREAFSLEDHPEILPWEQYLKNE